MITLTNANIYNITKNIQTEFNETGIYIPIQANFILQKNLKILEEALVLIEEARLQILQHYGILNEQQDQYDIPQENVSVVKQELENLLNIEQELNIVKCTLSDFGNIALTPAQMQAIMFMIEE